MKLAASCPYIDNYYDFCSLWTFWNMNWSFEVLGAEWAHCSAVLNSFCCFTAFFFFLSEMLSENVTISCHGLLIRLWWAEEMDCRDNRNLPAVSSAGYQITDQIWGSHTLLNKADLSSQTQNLDRTTETTWSCWDAASTLCWWASTSASDLWCNILSLDDQRNQTKTTDNDDYKQVIKSEVGNERIW